MHRTLIAFAATALIASPALADRGPSQDEAAKIAASLTAAGFKSWNKIEFSGSVWKVDDARSIEGKTYDLQLSPSDFGIIRKDGD
ncbi:PepSY domain-containing protein [Sphingomonas sp. ID0503]|uniref:PepSY domain-containing protein n=1 Tax=Sphingomonas sp. ID0503 TaxID=3399691 RepID=UPI003AFB211C